MRQTTEAKFKIVYQEEKSENKILAIFVDLLLAFILMWGLFEYILDWTAMDTSYRLKLYIITGLGVVSSVLAYYLFDKKIVSILVSPCMAIVVVAVKGIQSMYYGFFGFLNYIISWWNINKEDGVTLVMESNITSEDVYAFVLVVSLLIATVWLILIYNRRFLLSIILALGIVTIGLIIGRFSAVGCSTLMTGCVGIWLLRVRRRHGYQQLGWFALIGFLLVIISVFTDDGQMRAAVSFKEQIEKDVEYIRYGKDTLPEGDLYKADKMLSRDDDTLIVTTSQNKNIYLKGFVGDRYQNGRWSTLPKLSYRGDNSGMLKWLENLGFIPQNQYAYYMENDKDTQIKKNTIKIKNVGANRSYIYMPYSAEQVSQFGIDTNYDNNYQSGALFGEKTYQYDEWSGTRPGELLYANSWVSNPQNSEQTKYAEAESVYANFVYNNYLELDDNMSEMINSIFFDGWESDNTIYSVTERIRDVLNSRAYYEELPESAPEGIEPISWFLNKGHQGNSAMFASAAVLAFRAQGIPARYVEGYLVTENETRHADNGTVTLTNKDSHAWVEVYLDGVGFVPIDVTPGFYYDTYTLLQMVQKPQNVSQKAAEEDSSESGNEVDDKTGETDNNNNAPIPNKKIVISLTIIAYVILAFTFIAAIFEVVYFVHMLTYEKKYDKLSKNDRVKCLTNAIFLLISLYGYKAELGWQTDDTDCALAEGIDGIFKGEYIRVTDLIEKNIYGQEELMDSEIKVIYNFAEKLYEARKSKKLTKRLKIRYMPCTKKKIGMTR